MASVTGLYIELFHSQTSKGVEETCEGVRGLADSVLSGHKHTSTTVKGQCHSDRTVL